jgi:hypothetical protein
MTVRLLHGVCSKLRTKTMYLFIEGRGDPEDQPVTNSAVFWCLKTQGCLGPDDLPVSPEACKSGRACAVVRPEA